VYPVVTRSRGRCGPSRWRRSPSGVRRGAPRGVATGPQRIMLVE
jgi:hypothetical protein